MPIQLFGPRRSKNPSPSVETAYAFIVQDRLPEALSLLNDILRQSPENAVALALRGQAYGRMGKISNALADLSRSVQLDPSNVDAYFNYAIALAKADKEPEALAAISRVVQLNPNDEEARAWRNRLAAQLGLEELDQVARVLEQFAYSQCGNGKHWQVALREMYLFQPHLPHQTYNAAILDLRQMPQALVEVTASPDGYKVKLSVEQRFPEVSRATFVEVISEESLAEPTALLTLLHGWLSRGILKTIGDRLRYEAQ